MHWCLLGTAHRAFGNYVLIQCPSGRNRLWQNFFTRGAERYLQVETYEVRPAYAGGRKLNAAVSVPGSKSITNRALMLAALADGTTTLRGALMSDDSRASSGAFRISAFLSRQMRKRKPSALQVLAEQFRRRKHRSMWEVPGRRPASSPHSSALCPEYGISMLPNR